MKHTKDDIFTAKEDYLGLYKKGEKYKINETIRDGKYEKVYLEQNGIKISEHRLRWFELVLYFSKNK